MRRAGRRSVGVSSRPAAVSILQAIKEQRRVVLTLRSAAAELYALPWELITLKRSGQHIGELQGVLVHKRSLMCRLLPRFAPTGRLTELHDVIASIDPF